MHGHIFILLYFYMYWYAWWKGKKTDSAADKFSWLVKGSQEFGGNWRTMILPTVLIAEFKKVGGNNDKIQFI